MAELIATLYKHGHDDYEIWFLDLPKEAIAEIEAIFDRYRDTGSSVRGTKDDIRREI